MARTELPITNGFYESRSAPQSNQQCINWYVQPTEVSGLSAAALFGTPGMAQIATTGEVQQANRGSHVKAGIAYFVNGIGLYRITQTILGVDETFSVDLLGTIPGTGRVSMADNGTQLMVLVPGGNGYIFNENAGTPFQQITDPDFNANGIPQFCVFIDGYFVITTDGKKFIVSSLNDGLSWDALDFGTAEADPDNIVAPIVHRNQLFIGGSETIEVFQNIGGSGFPFQRVEGFVIPVGVFSPFSIVEGGGTFLFIGGVVNGSPQVYAFTGNDVQVISTDAIDDILLGLTSEDVAFSVSYSQAGAKFVAFTFLNRTFVYDFVSKTWHERSSRVTAQGITRDIRWRVNSLITAYGRVLVADGQDGRIGELDLNIFDEYGQNIIRTVSTMPFSNQGLSVFVPQLELTIESGVGDANTPNPVMRMSRSQDGKTFTDERTRKMGKIGEYNKRLIWRRNGRVGRFELFKFVTSEKVKPVIIKLEADILGGTK